MTCYVTSSDNNMSIYTYV